MLQSCCAIAPKLLWQFAIDFALLFVQLYPVMLSGYVSQEFPSVDNGWLIGLRFFALVVVVALNIKGELVFLSSSLLTTAVVLIL